MAIASGSRVDHVSCRRRSGRSFGHCSVVRSGRIPRNFSIQIALWNVRWFFFARGPPIVRKRTINRRSLSCWACKRTIDRRSLSCWASKLLLNEHFPDNESNCWLTYHHPFARTLEFIHAVWITYDRSDSTASCGSCHSRQTRCASIFLRHFRSELFNTLRRNWRLKINEKSFKKP